MNARQLALPFAYAPHYHASEFLSAGSNEAVRAWLARPGDWPQGRLAMWGEAGSGKTHLLHVWGDVVVPAPQLRGVPLLPEATRIGIDDADAAVDEAALLHLLNAAAENNRLVLLADRQPPARWLVRLPDLASRLRATAAVRIEPPEDSLLQALFSRLLADRQLVVPVAVQEWLVQRLPRTAGAIREAAARLDRASLALGGRVTRAVAARVLDEMELAGEGEALSEDLEPETGQASPDHAVLL